MNKILILCFVSIVSTNALAGSGDALAGVVAGVAVGAAATATVASGVVDNESKYWLDPKVKTTSQLSYQCGLIIETQVLDYNPFSVLFLGIKNEGKIDSEVLAYDSYIDYNNGRTRFFDLDLHPPVFILSRASQTSYFKFHQKKDFVDAGSMNIIIPVRQADQVCNLNISYLKNQDYKPEVGLIDSETITFGVYTGVSSVHGSLTDFMSSKTSAYGMFDMTFMGKNNHGMYLGIGFSSYKATTAYRLTNPLQLRDEWRSFLTGIGYVNRSIFDESQSMHLRLGVSSGSLDIGENKDAVTESKKITTVDVGIKYNYKFADVERGVWVGKYFASIGLQSNYIPIVSDAGTKKSGFLNSVYFGLIAGF